MFKFVQNFGPRLILKSFYRNISHKQCPPPNKSAHKEGGYKVYKYLTFVVGFPAIFAAAAMCYIQKKSRECEDRPPFVPYESMRRRTKRFPWGDGTKSLFHNPAVNALPNGYEPASGLECAPEVDNEEGEESEE